MIPAARTLAVILSISATGAIADPLPDMGGDWSGSGWARQTPDGPQEAVRCRLKNVYAPAALALAVNGRCVVPGRRITLSGEVRGDAATDRITGRWANPDGIGSTRITGIQRDDLVAFTFRASDPQTGRNLAQNIEWRIIGDTLRLRSTDRTRPDTMMMDMTFTR